MSKSLGGSIFIYNGIKQDYCYRESIMCLAELCDQVSIVDAGSDDGTAEDLVEYLIELTAAFGDKFIYTRFTNAQWHEQVGREKLSYFTNQAISKLTTEWVYNQQADEITHEASFEFIRQAIEHDVDAYFCRRLNLWKTPWMMLNVEQNRKPVSTEVVRLAKMPAYAYDDAEQLAVQSVHIFGDIDLIQIFHMGFVRDPVKHLAKIDNMQKEIFLWGDIDVKAKDCTEFQADRWFDPEKDLIPIPKPLPVFIQKWAADRYHSAVQ
jgi:hypothetical protein